MKRFLGTLAVALALVGLASTAQAELTVNYDRAIIEGLDGEGYFVPGTTSLTVQISVTSSIGGANTDPLAAVNILKGLAFKEQLPTGWSYGGLVQPNSANPTIEPAVPTGLIGFSWITPPATPFSFSYKINVPADEPGGQTLSGTATFRTNGSAIAITPPANDDVNVKPTTVSISRAISGAGVAGSSNQFYVPGQEITVDITVTKDGPANMTVLAVRDTLPANWSYAGLDETDPDKPTIPPPTPTGTIAFSWITPPATPFTFQYRVLVPADEAGLDRVMSAVGTYRLGGGAIQTNTVDVTLNPRPCVQYTMNGVGGDFYAPGVNKSISVNITEDCLPNLTGLAVRQTLPAGWAYVGLDESDPQKPTIPPPTPTGEIAFSWISVPAAPFSFTYIVSVPADQLGDVEIPGRVTYRLGGGALATDQFILTLSGADVTAPVITITGDNPATVECGTGYTDAGATASDDRDGDVTGNIVPTNTVDANTPGSYTVTYDVVDAAGNAASAVRNVEVVDTTAPTVTLNGLAAVTVECGQPYTELGASASDSCDTALTAATVSGTVDNTTPGTYTVSYDATDASGNAATTVTRTVTVEDTTDPVVTITGGNTATVECHTAFTAPGATASDSCEGALAVGAPSGTVDADTPGTYTLTYSVADASGNTGSATLTVTVQDTTAPTIALNGGAVNVECGTSYQELGATASDSCDATVDVQISGSVNAAQPGTYTITYNASDDSGNDAVSVTRTVTVSDTTDPVLDIGATSVTVECGNSYTDANGTATDTCDGNVLVTNNAATAVDSGNAGTYTVTVTATDDSGNSVSATRTVTVQDTTAPAISLTGNTNVVVECGENYTDAGATANDACEGSLTASIVRGGSVDTATPGDYTLTFNVSDGAGNAAAEVTRVVTVTDTTDPVITVNPGQDTVECGTEFTDAGATVADSCDSAATVTASGSVDTTTPGTYTITYSSTDASGNDATATRTVTVVDTTDPVVQLNGGAVTVECGGSYDEAGATATDSCDSSVAVVTTGTVNTSTPGDYLITYTATDDSGNDASVSRTVSVVDTTAPVITLNGSASVSVPCGGPYNELGATATDGCAGSVAVTTTGTVDVNTSGEYTIVYNATDGTNAATPVTRTVTVETCNACPDEDGNGLADDLFFCLDEDGESISFDVDGGTCNRHTYAQTWFGDVAGEDISVSQSNPDDPSQVFTASVARDIIGAGQQAILVLSTSCTLEDLLGDTAFNLGTTPDGEVAGNNWLDVSIVVSNDGGLTYQKLDNAILANSPVTITINGLNATAGAEVSLESYDTYIAPDEDTGLATIQAVLGDSWGSDGVACSYADGTITCEVTHLSVFGAFESLADPAAIEVTPSPAYDLIVGTVQLGAQATATLTVKNVGGGTLTGNATINSPNSKFTLVGDATFSLTEGASDTITVRFAPGQDTGNFTGTVTITNSAGAPVTVTVKGTGTLFNKRFVFFTCGGEGPSSSLGGDLAVVALALGGLYLSSRAFRRAKQS